MPGARLQMNADSYISRIVFPKLNLPEYDLRIRTAGNKHEVFDPIRKKFVALTPEEWVRQHFIRYLTEEKKYPASLIAVESGTTYNRLKKRTDIAVYDQAGKVWMIVECKAPDVKLSQDTFDQAAVYNTSAGARTEYLAITNGIMHFCCRLNFEQNSYAFLKDFPAHPRHG